jgi:hypothetical protein
MFEQLETRRMFAAALNAGLLSITGTSTHDTILISLSGDQLSVSENTVVTNFNAADVTTISVLAGSGNDYVSLGSNLSKPAYIRGQNGHDTLRGAGGPDSLYGDAGKDIIRGFGGADYISGGTGNDSCYGGTGVDSIEGGNGSDFLSGEAGSDVIWGEARPINLTFPNLPNNISSAVRPKVNFQIPMTINKVLLGGGAVPVAGPVKTMTNGGAAPSSPQRTTTEPVITTTEPPVFEVVTYNDLIVGGDGNDELHGNRGNDSIHGNDGKDSLWGDADSDKLYGGNHADELFGGAGADQSYGGAGNDSLVAVGGGATDSVCGDGGFDQLWLDSNGSEKILNADPGETIGGAVHRVGSFVGGVSKELNGQSIADPNADRDSYVGIYKSFKGKPLFGPSGPHMNDIDQGSIGDCYYLAGLSGIAKMNPQRIRNNIVSFGDGTFGVRHYEDNGTIRYYRVDADLPVVSNNSFTPRYADLGHGDSMWVALMEKVFAHFRSGANSYASLHGGGMSEPFRALGTTAAGITNLLAGTQNATLTNIRNALLSGKAVSALTPPDGPTNGAPVVGWHVYTVHSVQMNNGVPVSITLRNPWSTDGAGNDGVNDGYVTCTASQFFGYFSGATAATV